MTRTLVGTHAHLVEAELAPIVLERERVLEDAIPGLAEYHAPRTPARRLVVQRRPLDEIDVLRRLELFLAEGRSELPRHHLNLVPDVDIEIAVAE